MEKRFPNLCSPIRLGSVTFRNRMFAAPMGGTDITADCSVGPRTPGFYELRAKGGAPAVTAARRGHDVTLCEKTGELGGILKEEQAIPFKYEMYQLGVTLARIAEREGVKIRLNTTVTPELVAEEAPDALLLAVSALSTWAWRAKPCIWWRCGNRWPPTAISVSGPSS